VLTELAACELACVVDPDAGRRAEAAVLAPHARVSGDPEEALAARDIDAIVIAAPAASHVELACRAFAAGKHVLVEKPFATTLDGARAIAEACERSGRIGMVGHLLVFHPGVRKMRELLREHALGRPIYAQSIRANLGKIRRDENVLWCFGSHDVAVLDYLLGEPPVEVAAFGHAIVDETSEDVAAVTLRFGSGLLANLHLSRLHPRKERRLTLVGSRKIAELDDANGAALRVIDATTEDTIFKSDFDAPLRDELRYFVTCIQESSQPITSMASGLRVVATLAAAQTSLERAGALTKVAL
jgi:predicted dehydrogenase